MFIPIQYFKHLNLISSQSSGFSTLILLDAFHITNIPEFFLSFWLLSLVLFLAYQYLSCNMASMLVYNILNEA